MSIEVVRTRGKEHFCAGTLLCTFSIVSQISAGRQQQMGLAGAGSRRGQGIQLHVIQGGALGAGGQRWCRITWSAFRPSNRGLNLVLAAVVL